MIEINEMLTAIQSFFINNFNIETIYMEPVEDGLERPSIFIEYKPKPKILNKSRTKITLKCSVMYFIQENIAKTKDSLSVAEIQSTFLEKTKLGTIFYQNKAYRIEDIDFDKRLNEIVILFTLSREFLTEKDQVQKMGHLDLDMKFN